ncbi:MULTISPECIES: ATP-grasp ribosomal peptide maturase [Streptomyces]|uniref:ATP-grasp ribosomal peptide maturase n=1 Tax=Streptomyces TaxID=1883 RepID=UPI00226E610C|nr:MULTISPECIES: ATP-grasp ribosomal peptide maturase [unclassified Streptomyces]MCY0923297.1 ATP-grasp ribosomal peptide maturase [Streptomyces sp. H27-G5]MCY0943960.1 ATP-grasp ribosomal peptide maturase [Streptomyces sp. H34-AA3]MCY0956320.1 ATP-grasp ribosomal peptide maturase [Streptomyces sp. H27-H5]MCZ4082340.1 ATP-grasp ribosomal peptide maturase [Streptomyces sp. H34-S5]
MTKTEKRPVLVVTEADDITADMVITELNRRKVPVVRFNPADIGEGLTVSARFGTCPAPVAGQVRTPSRTADLAVVRSVYWRRPEWPTFSHLPPDDSRFAAAQVRYGLGGTLYALDGPLWVNHPLRVAAADYKPAQLALAQQLGFIIPPTVVTNDPDEARKFIRAQGDAIFKTLRWTPYAREGVPVTGWADPVTADEIDDSIRITPHLFQARVDKVADLRVLIVGRHTFAVRIESDLLDWRKDYSALTYSVEHLPHRVHQGLHAYLHHLGLVSGSFDLAVDRAGDYWWLELNPNGQWGWLETETGLPMSAAFADLLTQGDSR